MNIARRRRRLLAHWRFYCATGHWGPAGRVALNRAWADNGYSVEGVGRRARTPDGGIWQRRTWWP